MAVPATQHTETLTESHWTRAGHGPITALCEEAVAATPAMRSLCHFSNGIIDFTVLRRTRAPLSALVTEPGDETGNEALPGSRLLLSAQDLTTVLRPLGTGELMRTVVVNHRGGLWGGRARPGEFLAAVADSPDGAPAVDDAMNRLVARIRTEVHALPDELLGGDAENPFQPVATRPATVEEGSPRVDFGTAAAPDTAYEDRLRELWREHVNTLDLHYAAHYQDWTLSCVGDVFEADALGPRFLGVSIRTRRTAYRDLSRGLRGHLVRLTDAIGPVGPATDDRPPLHRIVLDVQEGAVYVLWTSPRSFLLGVTLDQRQVGNAEHRLTELARGIEGLTPTRTR